MPLAVIAVFLALDRHLSELGRWLSLLLFFPIKGINILANNLRLPDDHRILLVLSIGLPLLIVYWASIILLIMGRRRGSE